MVRALKGVLIECEPAVKQMILRMNSETKDHFVIDEDLDDTHLFVKAEAVPRIKERLDELLEANTYKIVDREVE